MLPAAAATAPPLVPQPAVPQPAQPAPAGPSSFASLGLPGGLPGGMQSLLFSPGGLGSLGPWGPLGPLGPLTLTLPDNPMGMLGQDPCTPLAPLLLQQQQQLWAQAAAQLTTMQQQAQAAQQGKPGGAVAAFGPGPGLGLGLGPGMGLGPGLGLGPGPGPSSLRSPPLSLPPLQHSSLSHTGLDGLRGPEAALSGWVQPAVATPGSRRFALAQQQQQQQHLGELPPGSHHPLPPLQLPPLTRPPPLLPPLQSLMPLMPHQAGGHMLDGQPMARLSDGAGAAPGPSGLPGLSLPAPNPLLSLWQLPGSLPGGGMDPAATASFLAMLPPGGGVLHQDLQPPGGPG